MKRYLAVIILIVVWGIAQAQVQSVGVLKADESKSSYLEHFIKTWNGKEQIAHGPNCFATALAASNTLDFHGHIEALEFGYWMRTPLCKKKKSLDQVESGNIVALGKGFDIEHAFLYVSDNLVFQKAYLQKDAAPELTTLPVALAPYSNKSLEELRLTNNNEDYKAEIYKCDSLKDFILQNYPEISNTRILRNIDFLQQDLAKYSFADIPSLGVINSAQGQIQSVRDKLMKQLLYLDVRGSEDQWPGPQEVDGLPRWLIKGLLLRTQSMDKQLNFLFLHARDELSKK